MGFQPVLYSLGLVLSAVAVVMLIPAAVGAFHDDGEWAAFVIGSVVTLFFAVSLALANKPERVSLTPRQAFLFIALAWTGVAAAGALPLAAATMDLSLTDAVFESVSGLTTTGSTILVDPDSAPQSILIWRALLQWLGGLGILGVVISLFPFLRIGGMQLFRMEMADRADRVLPRSGYVIIAIAAVYIALTLACILAFRVTAMGWFDAVAHGLATVSTGGYSTRTDSFGAFDGVLVQWVAIVFMLAGAMPFILYVRAARIHGALSGQGLRQPIGLLRFILLLVVVLSAWLIWTTDRPVVDVMTAVAFNVVSIITTTGYVSEDYQGWGLMAVGIFLFLTAIGGCSGSTAGGVKIFRFQLMGLMLREQLALLRYPHQAFARRYDGKAVDSDLIRSVAAFAFMYMITFVLATLLVLLSGVDFLTGTSAALAALSNVGPGLGPIIGPPGNFSDMPDMAKWVLSATMLIGRLEIYTFLVLILPRFWVR